MPKKPFKPHDEFFKAAFGRLEITLEYVQKMLPSELVEELDTSKLKRTNGSYISPALREFFSDLVFECPLKTADLRLSVSLLFEHKSNPETYPHFQVLRYMLDTWEEQLKQKKALTPIVPIIIYQGKENWIVRDFPQYFSKKLPLSLFRFIPSFDYHFTHITAMSDAQIIGLGQGLLINALLLMKYIHSPDYILQNPELIFIHLDEPGNQRDFIVSMLAYFLKNTELAQEKIQTFIKTLPGALNQTAMSTYEMILEEGRKEVRVILDRERQRTQEEHQRAQEEHQRAQEALRREEEERQRALEAIQREEEERQRLDGLILYLYGTAQLPIEQIASLSNRDIQYIEELIQKKED